MRPVRPFAVQRLQEDEQHEQPEREEERVETGVEENDFHWESDKKKQLVGAELVGTEN